MTCNKRRLYEGMVGEVPFCSNYAYDIFIWKFSVFFASSLLLYVMRFLVLIGEGCFY